MGRKLQAGHMAYDRGFDDELRSNRFCSVVAAAVVGAGATVYASNKASKAQGQATAAARESADRQMDMAEEQYDRYLNIYGPLEEEVIADAKGAGSIAEQEVAAGRAAADVITAQGGAKKQLEAQLSSLGVNPNDQKFVNTMASMDLDAAAQGAAAQTGARERVKELGFAKRKDLASLGKGLPSSSAQMMASAGQLQASAAGANASRWGSVASGLGGITGSVINSQQFQNWWNSSPTFNPTGGFGTGNAYGNQDLGQFF